MGMWDKNASRMIRGESSTPPPWINWEEESVVRLGSGTLCFDCSEVAGGDG